MDDREAASALVAQLTKQLEEHRRRGDQDGRDPAWFKRDIDLEAQLRQARLDLEVLSPG